MTPNRNHMTTTPHKDGIVQNYGPRRARQRRELAGLVSSVRKVLWRRPGRLILWVERDLTQARANGRGFFTSSRLEAPYSGRLVCLGGRGLLILTGRSPA